MIYQPVQCPGPRHNHQKLPRRRTARDDSVHAALFQPTHILEPRFKWERDLLLSIAPSVSFSIKPQCANGAECVILLSSHFSSKADATLSRATMKDTEIIVKYEGVVLFCTAIPLLRDMR